MFELPQEERTGSPRRDTARASAVRDAAHEANAAREAARRNDPPPRAAAGKPRAAEDTAKTTRDTDKDVVADSGETGREEPRAEQVELAAGTVAQPAKGEDTAKATDATEAEGEASAIVIEPAPAPVMGEARLQPADSASPAIAGMPAEAVTGSDQPAPVASDTGAQPALVEAAAAVAAAATALPVVGAAAPATASDGTEVAPGAASPVGAPSGPASPPTATGSPAIEVAATPETTKTDDQGTLARAEGDTRPVTGTPDKDKTELALDGQPKAEAGTRAETPATARDARIEMPAGLSVQQPRSPLDPPVAESLDKAPTTHQQTAESRPTPINAVPLEIGLRAMAGGKRFDIRLDPAELGRVDVRLEIDDAGQVTAKLTVDRVETLHLLQRDARTLERAFEQAGLKPSDSGVNISLRDQSGQQGFGQADRDTPEQNARRSRAFVHIEPEIAEAQGIRRALGPGRIDLSI